MPIQSTKTQSKLVSGAVFDPNRPLFGLFIVFDMLHGHISSFLDRLLRFFLAKRQFFRLIKSS